MSTRIKLTRIDKRLLHTTVALNWNQLIDTNNILIIDSDYVNGPFIADVMRFCLPRTIKAEIFSIEQLLKYINEGHNIKTMVIFLNLSITCDAVKAGFRTKEIRIPYPTNRVMIRSLSDCSSEEDTEKIRYTQNQGIRMFFQAAPFNSRDYSIFKK